MLIRFSEHVEHFAQKVGDQYAEGFHYHRGFSPVSLFHRRKPLKLLTEVQRFLNTGLKPQC